MDDLSFFEKIGILAEKGVDVRSQTWNALVHYRAVVAHNMGSHQMRLQMFAHMLQERAKREDLRESLSVALERLKTVMDRLCFENRTSDGPGD